MLPAFITSLPQEEGLVRGKRDWAARRGHNPSRGGEGVGTEGEGGGLGGLRQFGCIYILGGGVGGVVVVVVEEID